MSSAASTLPPRTDVERIPEIVARLRETFRSGRTRPLEWRETQLRRLGELLSRHGDELVAALQADLRKPDLEAWMADIASTRAEAELARRKLRAWTKPERVRVPLSQRPGRARIVRDPLGVVLVIGPWNYPVQLVLTPLVGALAAGNCAVLKPSEVTAHTSAALARLLPRYLDPDAVAVVEGGVAETTALLAERFDHVFYTGNGRVGRVVMAAAARHLTPVTLELGGKSPCLVDSDVDLDVAVRRIAWGKFLNAGQTCIAPDYVLVHESRERELLDGLVRTLREFYGDDPQRSPDLARIASDRHHERLAKLLESGEVVAGGRTDAADRYVAPTILRGVRPDSPVMEEEIFGPILPVIAVRDMDQAIDLVSQREKPLALYLFTRRPEVEERVVSRTSSGGVCVNATLWHIANPNLPFGGVGESGLGAYHGRHTFEVFSHRKSVLRKPTRFDVRFVYPPYSKRKLSLLKRLL
jgi:aldehyde dehydrogenase (NAD+)